MCIYNHIILCGTALCRLFYSGVLMLVATDLSCLNTVIKWFNQELTVKQIKEKKITSYMITVKYSSSSHSTIPIRCLKQTEVHHVFVLSVRSEPCLDMRVCGGGTFYVWNLYSFRAGVSKLNHRIDISNRHNKCNLTPYSSYNNTSVKIQT